jgi:hypothetical protein
MRINQALRIAAAAGPAENRDGHEGSTTQENQ